MNIELAFNFRKASDRIYTAGVVPEPALKRLKDQGFDAVINLLPPDSQYAVENEQTLVESQGIDYYLIPVDYDAPTIEDFLQFEQQMSALEGRHLLIHCAANYRVSVFYALWAERRLGWSIEEGDAFILGMVDPSKFPAWRQFIQSVRDTQ